METGLLLKMHIMWKSSNFGHARKMSRRQLSVLTAREEEKHSEKQGERKKGLGLEEESEYIQRSSIPTMHFQKSLPRLPIPKLEDTCRRYVTCQKALLSGEALAATESCVRQFLGNEGPVLQRELQRQDSIDKWRTSYISGPWFDMYLRDRKALPLNYNPAFAFTQEAEPGYNDRLVKSTNLIVSSLRFMKSLRAGLLEPEVFHLNPAKSNTPTFRRLTGLLPSSLSWYGAYLFNAYPLDMSQYHNLFSSTRVPRPEKDEIVQDTSARHVLVLRKGHFYAFDVIDRDGRILEPRQIAANLSDILRDPRPANQQASVGQLTASDRSVWAEWRSRLAPANARLFSKIDSALFVLALDEDDDDDSKHGGEPDKKKLMRQFLYGDPSNRWFDKSFSLIVTRDGYAGLNFEHSWGDGVAVLRYFEELRKDIAKNPSLGAQGVAAAAETPTNVERLDFQLNEAALVTIAQERSKFWAWVEDLDLDYFISQDLTKSSCKTFGVSPDAMMQLGFQLAMYKLHERSFPTYESCSTAAFRFGRTETVRPCTLQTLRFCVEMTKAQRSGTVTQNFPHLRNLIDECSKAHVQLTKEAAMGQGFDRHLFALKRLSEKKGGSPPGIFVDPAYAAINHNVLSTSTLSSPFVLGGGFGPVVRDGYGIGYMAKEDSVGTAVTSYKSSRSASRFVSSLKSSIKDINSVLSQAARK